MLWVLVGAMAVLFVLLQLPAVQSYIGTKVSKVLGEELGTIVTIGSVDIGMLNRVIIDDLRIYDQQEELMLSASRVSTKIELSPLFDGRISLSSAQLFGIKAYIYKENADATPNYQFVLDSLSSGDDSGQSPIDLNIRSLIVRNGHLRYDQLDQPRRSTFDPHHIDIRDFSCHVILHRMTENLLDLKVKKFSFREQSGLDLQQFTAHLHATPNGARVTQLKMSLPHSELVSDTLEATYIMKGKQLDMESIAFNGDLSQMHLQPSDLSFLMPGLADINDPIQLSTRFTGTRNTFSVSNLSVSAPNTLNMNVSGSVHDLSSTPKWILRVGHLDMQATALNKILLATGLPVALPPQVLTLGKITYQGELGGDSLEYAARGMLTTDIGNLDFTTHLNGNHIIGHADTDGLDLGRLLNTDRLGMVATSIDIDGMLPVSKDMTLTAKGGISRLDFNHHTYSNITVDGLYAKESFSGILGIDDPDGQISVEGRFDLSSTSPSAHLTASAHHFNPEAIGLLSDLKGHVFDFTVNTQLTGSHLNDLHGHVDVEGFNVQAPDKHYALSNLHIDVDHTSRDKHLTADCDFGHLSLSGQYDIEHLADALFNIVADKLPSLPILPRNTVAKSQQYQFSADIDRSDWLRQLTGIDLTINSPLSISGSVDEPSRHLDLNIIAPSIEYDEGDYRDIEVRLNTENDVLMADAHLSKMQDNGLPLEIALQSNAYDNKLNTDLAFNNHGENHRLRGTLSTTTFFPDDRTVYPSALITLNSSNIFVNDTPWDVEPSRVEFSKGDIIIDHFTIKNGEQHIIVEGRLSDSSTDTIHADLNQLDAEFLSNILNVRGVDFGGRITGNAYVSSLYDTPKAEAALFIDNFKFLDGRIGDMSLNARFDGKDQRILLDGIATDGEEGTTKVDGFVGLSPGELSLNIGAHGTPLHFLHRFCDSFLGDLGARVEGNVWLHGPLSDINMEGMVVANGDLTVTTLNTTYTMRNDTVVIVPDHIIFQRDTIYDREGHYGILTGSVDHESLSNFTYGINIHANNLLAYDFKEFGNDTFCGTVYATGDCNIKDDNGDVTIDIDVTPNKNTVFYYNAASPDILSSQDFITWRDITPEAIDYSNLPSASDNAPVTFHTVSTATVTANDEQSSNLHINFCINATPDAALRLLMDAESGDYIALYGNGNLRASYFNKGAFNLFGNYVVDHGIYKLTIQNVIKKEFQFEQGGTISFGGNPYDAVLDLKAIYVVNSVPLSDLNIGNSFTSNNIRVNCIMNIDGTPEHPTVDFDLEMPTVNSDAQQMVLSVINGEEELNQQVIYLLAIGRFYNQNAQSADAQGPSQTSLAMQSLLSGTISQQINSVLNNVIKTSNWNFGANISTGNEGFNNAEYEGLLSGNLLNNRLQINGQFGYRDNPNATTSFIGDFDIRYLLYPNGNLAVKVYNQTNDRYFVKNSLNTQGLGLIMKKDFNGWRELLGINRKKKQKKQ